MIDIKQELLDYIDELHKRDLELDERIHEATHQATQTLLEELQKKDKRIKQLEQELDKALLVQELRVQERNIKLEQVIEGLMKELVEERMRNKYSPWVNTEHQQWAENFMKALLKKPPM